MTISDPLGITEQGLPTTEYGNIPEVFHIKMIIVSEKEVRKIVAGLPKPMNTSLGESAREALSFTERLRNPAGIPAKTTDERLSTTWALSTSPKDIFSESNGRTL